MTADLLSREIEESGKSTTQNSVTLPQVVRKSDESNDAVSPARSLKAASDSTGKYRKFKLRFADEGLESLWGSDTEGGSDVREDWSEVDSVKVLKRGKSPNRFGM